MFTGIIEELGEIEHIIQSHNQNRLSIRCSKVVEDCSLGDSIAVNGVCLTVISFSNKGFAADVSGETWKRSTLASLKKGKKVNLERALRIGGKMGGHFVQGHVDCTASLLSVLEEGDFFVPRFLFPQEYSPYIVEKGSISIDGISLTVAVLEENQFTCAIVPHTWENTNLRFLKPGDTINLEVDVLAKYVFRLLETSGLLGNSGQKKKTLELTFLQEHGFA